MDFNYKNQKYSAAPFAQCPHCRNLIKLEIENETVLTNSRICPTCKMEISEDEIAASFAGNLIITAAVQSAGKVLGLDAALLIFFFVIFFEMTVLYFVKDAFPYSPHVVFAFTAVWFLGGFILTNKWLKDFGIFEAEDEDFVSAKKNIKLSRLVWTAAFILNLSLWLVYLTNF